MSDKPINDGGPAFPVTCGEAILHGMSVRTWLAGMVIQGLLAAGELAANAAEDAVWHTDMLIAELEKERPEEKPGG